MKVFRLSSVGYDYGRDWFFQGPDNMTEDTFRAICGGLMPEAAQTALAASKESNKTVQWVDIMFALEQSLLIHGFEVYDMPTKTYMEQWAFDVKCKYADEIGPVLKELDVHNFELTKDNWRNATDS